MRIAALRQLRTAWISSDVLDRNCIYSIHTQWEWYFLYLSAAKRKLRKKITKINSWRKNNIAPTKTNSNQFSVIIYFWLFVFRCRCYSQCAMSAHVSVLIHIRDYFQLTDMCTNTVIHTNQSKWHAYDKNAELVIVFMMRTFIIIFILIYLFNRSPMTDLGFKITYRP